MCSDRITGTVLQSNCAHDKQHTPRALSLIARKKTIFPKSGPYVELNE